MKISQNKDLHWGNFDQFHSQDLKSQKAEVFSEEVFVTV